MEPQDEIKAKHWTRALLQPDQLDPRILEELADPEIVAFEGLKESVGLINRLLSANRTAKSLKALRTTARAGNREGLVLEDGLLLYQDRLVVPDVDNIRTDLIREAYE